MDDIWVKNEERSNKLLFLSLLTIIYTLLISSGNLTGTSILYLIFLSSSVFYYLIISGKKINGYILLSSTIFISTSFILYVSEVFSGKSFTPFFDFKTPLLLIIGVGIVIGMLPENVRSEFTGDNILFQRFSP